MSSQTSTVNRKIISLKNKHELPEYLLLSWERTNSTQSCSNQQVSFEEQMVLISLFTMVGYLFQLKLWSFLCVIQFLTVPSLLCCRPKTERQLQSACSHHILRCSSCGIPCLVENGFNYMTVTLVYPFYSRVQLFQI